MDCKILLIIACTILTTSAWSVQNYPHRRIPMRYTRFAPAPPYMQKAPHQRVPIRLPLESPDDAVDVEPQWTRPKRGHDYHDHDHDHEHRGTSGVTGPVHTFVKTDKNANYKWGVRHHVGDKYAS